MIFHSYTVDERFVSSSTINWQITGNGSFVVGEKDGNPFFLKRLEGIRVPNPDLITGDAYTRMADKFKRSQTLQERIRSALSSFSVRDGIAPIEETFVDANRLVIVTPFLEGGTVDIELDEAWKQKRLLMKMAGELFKIHSLGLVHSDIKEENFIFRKNYLGVSPTLIDFDQSFFLDNPPAPEEAGGSEGYMAPELLRYMETPEGKTPSVKLTPAIDVFALGITFCVLLTGRFPSFPEEYSSAGGALNGGASLSVPGGVDPDMKGLLSEMLEKNPARRITAKNILNELTGRRPEKAASASVCETVEGVETDGAPWEEGWSYNIEELLKRKIRSIKKGRNDAGTEGYRTIKGTGPVFYDCKAAEILRLVKKP